MNFCESLVKNYVANLILDESASAKGFVDFEVFDSSVAKNSFVGPVNEQNICSKKST